MLYFVRNSLERGAVINFLRMWEGAVKWRLRFFLREDVTLGLSFMMNSGQSVSAENMFYFPVNRKLRTRWVVLNFILLNHKNEYKREM